MILVFAPQRAQLVLMDAPAQPGVEPGLLGQEIGAMARRNDIAYVDLASAWRDRTDKDAMYYRLDGHPNAHGHELISQALDRTLTSGMVPQLASCRRT